MVYEPVQPPPDPSYDNPPQPLVDPMIPPVNPTTPPCNQSEKTAVLERETGNRTRKNRVPAVQG